MKGSAKQDLAEAVREKLKSLSKKQIDFATENLLDHNDFRVQLTRNAFSFYTLETIVRLLESEDVSDLREEYDFTEIEKRKDEILSPVQIVQDRISRSLKTPDKDDLVINLRTLYTWLKKDDLVVICSLNESPLEYSYDGWDKLGDVYTEAVKEQAIFLYIRPSQKVLDNFPKRFLHDFFSRSSPKEEVETLRQNVMQAGVSKDKAEKHIRLFEPDFCPFWTMGMRFGFYSILKENKPRDKALFARFPIGGSLSGNVVDKNLILFGNKNMRDAFQAYLTICFNREENNLTDLISRLKENPDDII